MSALPYADWRDTLETLHRWTRIGGNGFAADLRKFVLPWPDGGGGESDVEGVLTFLRAAYAAAADLGGWSRPELEPQ